MEEHKLLTGMLLVALVVSVVGTVITADRLSGLSTSSNTFTGAAIGGEGNLTIESVVSFTMADTLIEFKNGSVAYGYTYAILESNNSNVFQGTWDKVNDQMTIENDGTVPANITVGANKQAGIGANSFACDGDQGNCGIGLSGTGNPDQATSFSFKMVDTEGGCDVFEQVGWKSFAAHSTPYEVCNCLQNSDPKDLISFDLQVGIPEDADGVKSSTLTFDITASERSASC